MRISLVTFILILFLSENTFAQQAPIKNDASVSLMNKLQLSIQFYPAPLIIQNYKMGIGLKINKHLRLNIIGAYGKKKADMLLLNANNFLENKNRLKFEIQFLRKIDKHPSLFVAPYLSYYEATILYYQDTTTANYMYRITENYSKIISPGGIIGIHDEFLYHFGFECFLGLGYKFQVGDYPGNFSHTYRTYEPRISFRAEASFYFNFYKGRKKKFNLLD